MPAETTSAAGTQAAPTTQPQAGAPSQAPEADAQQPQAGSADGEGTGPDAATLQRELTAARREAANYRTKLKGYEDAQKSESEKATERIAELERERDTLAAARREDTLRLAASAAARKLGYRNPDIAYRLLSTGSVDFDEAGAPKNVDKLLDDIAKAEPYLVQTTTDYGGGPRGSSPNAGIDMNARIRRATGRA